MIFQLSGLRSLSFMLLAIAVSCIADVRQSVLFEDQFSTLPDGPITGNLSLKPYYFLPEAVGNAGGWMVATSMKIEGFNHAWRINSNNKGKYLSQTFENLNSHYEPLSMITHPLIIAGNSYWEDYSVEFSFSPRSAIDKCGLVFRFQDENNYYFFGMEGNTIMLKQVHQTTAPKRPLERILAFKPFIWQPGEMYKGNVSLRGDKIYALLNDSISLHARDTTFERGRIGLLSDMPADFYSLETRILNSEQRKFNRFVSQIDKMIENYISSNPQMVVWKKLGIHRLGGDINIRFGDLTSDGSKEVILVQSGKQTGSNENEIGCITAMDLDGEILWQYGKPVEKYNKFTASLPVHIHDLDGDGNREIIFINGGRLYVLGGQTGQLKRSTGLPPGFSPEVMIFADLMGIGRDNCIVIGDRKSFIMALNDKFKVLWQTKTESGSHPVNVDLDGDQKDEILFGYNILDPEGNIIRDAGGSIGDDCNGVAITGTMDQDINDRRIVYAAGDWGLLYFNLEGILTRQHTFGYVGYFSIADYDIERPGLEVVASNSWGGPGVMGYVGAEGDLIAKYHINTLGTTCTPVNWKGDGEEFYILNANHAKGGLFNGEGIKQVEFPDDGHPDLCYAVLDFTGDPRDEIVVWDADYLWIYTQNNNPRAGNTYDPERIPLYNYSVNQMHTSYSDW